MGNWGERNGKLTIPNIRYLGRVRLYILKLDFSPYDDYSTAQYSVF